MAGPPDRLGASIYVQDTEPAASLLTTVGHYWFDTSQTPGVLRIAASIDPVVWKMVQTAPVDAFPVGSVCLLAVTTNPADLLGYGTWAARAPVGQHHAWERIT